MYSSNLRSSFNIDDILCQSATASRSSVSVSATRGAFSDHYSSSMTGQTQFIPTLFDLIPPRYYFPHAHPYPTPAPPPPPPSAYIDPYALNVFQKGEYNHKVSIDNKETVIDISDSTHRINGYFEKLICFVTTRII